MSEMIQTYGELVRAYLELNVSLAPLISIFLRTAAIVLAPLPGTPVDLMNLALFTKMAGFIYAEVGIVLGSCINFYIARKFGEPMVSKFIDISKIHIWEERIEREHGFWGLVTMRVGTVVISDYISYVCGLTKMSFRRFFTTTVVASLPLVGAFYYFGGILFDTELILTISLIIPIMFLYSLFKKGKIFRKFNEYLSIQGNVDKLNNFLQREKKDKTVMRD